MSNGRTCGGFAQSLVWKDGSNKLSRPGGLIHNPPSPEPERVSKEFRFVPGRAKRKRKTKTHKPGEYRGFSHQWRIATVATSPKVSNETIPDVNFSYSDSAFGVADDRNELHRPIRDKAAECNGAENNEDLATIGAGVDESCLEDVACLGPSNSLVEVSTVNELRTELYAGLSTFERSTDSTRDRGATETNDSTYSLMATHLPDNRVW
jgi:hypothetical protein